MAKRLLDVGSCGPDHHSLAQFARHHFGAVVEQAHTGPEALESIRSGRYDLVTINRIIDHDGSEGLELIKAIKGDAQLSHTRVMMITNFDDHQQRAVSEGAEPGFGKSQLHAAQTIDRLRGYLS